MKTSQLHADYEEARALSEGPVEETLIAASISLLAEGVAVLLFFAFVGLLCVLRGTSPL